MNPVLISGSAFACFLGAGLVGMLLQSRYAPVHLSAQTRQSARSGVLLLGLVAAVMIGMLLVSLKSGFNAAEKTVAQMSADVTELDRELRDLGPTATPARALLLSFTGRVVSDTWPDTRPPKRLDQRDSETLLGQLETVMADLPGDTAMRARQDLRRVVETRWSMLEMAGPSLPLGMIAVVVFWVMLVFGCLGLSIRIGAALVLAIVLGALALALATFFVAEYDEPFVGLIVVSTAPMDAAIDTMTH